MLKINGCLRLKFGIFLQACIYLVGWAQGYVWATFFDRKSMCRQCLANYIQNLKVFTLKNSINLQLHYNHFVPISSFRLKFIK